MAAPNGSQNQGVSGLQIQGGAAIVAPAQAFQNGLPPNALVVVPLTKPTDELKEKLEKGPLAVTQEQMWTLLGFNGPAVQVQDDQGRPVVIGLEDLLDGLDKHWKENPSDLKRARIYAQELLKHQKLQRAEQVLSKLVAKGGNGDDWLALGIAQLQQDKLDKAEGTLKGASNLLKQSPYPQLHLARVFEKKGDKDAQMAQIDKSLEIDAGCVDAWAYLYQTLRDADGEEKAVAAIEEKAKGKRNAAPWVALQGFYASNAETRPKAIEFAQKGVEANGDDPIAVLCLSALYGQSGNMEKVVELLSKHESKMSGNVALANNYFEALFQTRQIDKVTKLLNSLAGSPNREVKQFAVQRSQLVAQYLQQQQQRLAQAAKA
jgi:cellobiose-specific phosphotransferase system component IIA